MKARSLFAAFLCALFGSASAFAATEIACWNMYSKKGSRPALKARIAADNVLAEARFDFTNEWFQGYEYDDVRDSGGRWDHKQERDFSTLEQPAAELTPERITSNHSPYKGNNEYAVRFGRHGFHSAYYNEDGEYFGRLILPVDLSPEALREYRIRNDNERSNAVMIARAPANSHTGGDVFLRLFCASK